MIRSTIKFNVREKVSSCSSELALVVNHFYHQAPHMLLASPHNDVLKSEKSSKRTVLPAGLDAWRWHKAMFKGCASTAAQDRAQLLSIFIINGIWTRQSLQLTDLSYAFSSFLTNGVAYICTR